MCPICWFWRDYRGTGGQRIRYYAKWVLEYLLEVNIQTFAEKNKTSEYLAIVNAGFFLVLPVAIVFVTKAFELESRYGVKNRLLLVGAHGFATLCVSSNQVLLCFRGCGGSRADVYHIISDVRKWVNHHLFDDGVDLFYHIGIPLVARFR